MQVIYVEARIIVADGHDPEKICEELEYSFTHPGILSSNLDNFNCVEEK